MNNTIELLDTVKGNLRETFSIIYDSSYKIEFDELVSNNDFRKCIIIIKKIGLEKGEEISEFLKGCRTVEEFLKKIFKETNNRNATLEVISDAFNPYIDYLEENMYEVEIVKVDVEIPEVLTYVSITNALANCESRIGDGDYSGAITSAKTLVEGVCKEILLIKGIEVQSETDSLPKLYNNLTKVLNLDSSNPKLDTSLKEITSGLNKIIKGLAEVRNLSGDSHAKTVKPSFHHAVLAVNSAKTVTSFLFHTYEYQREKSNTSAITD